MKWWSNVGGGGGSLIACMVGGGGRYAWSGTSIVSVDVLEIRVVCGTSVRGPLSYSARALNGVEVV